MFIRSCILILTLLVTTGTVSIETAHSFNVAKCPLHTTLPPQFPYHSHNSDPDGTPEAIHQVKCHKVPCSGLKACMDAGAAEAAQAAAEAAGNADLFKQILDQIMQQMQGGGGGGGGGGEQPTPPTAADFAFDDAFSGNLTPEETAEILGTIANNQPEVFSPEEFDNLIGEIETIAPVTIDDVTNINSTSDEQNNQEGEEPTEEVVEVKIVEDLPGTEELGLNPEALELDRSQLSAQQIRILDQALEALYEAERIFEDSRQKAIGTLENSPEVAAYNANREQFRDVYTEVQNVVSLLLQERNVEAFEIAGRLVRDLGLAKTPQDTLEQAEDLAFQLAGEAVNVPEESGYRDDAFAVAQAALDQVGVIAQAITTGDSDRAEEQFQDLQEYVDGDPIFVATGGGEFAPPPLPGEFGGPAAEPAEESFVQRFMQTILTPYFALVNLLSSLF